jgi:hypothetical protein
MNRGTWGLRREAISTIWPLLINPRGLLAEELTFLLVSTNGGMPVDTATPQSLCSSAVNN